ncbi:MAG: hypothetical protein O0X04_03815, partial [Methanocorpusculum sp.]|nr:hypothetical protein [Methanocorpusculum sp.]
MLPQAGRVHGPHHEKTKNITDNGSPGPAPLQSAVSEEDLRCISAKQQVQDDKDKAEEEEK